ncbi:TIGR03773 family transporter-associated surface protein [Streptomyces polyrhachis]|uniref:TIGR03773 family transporter-associated surface protein n=1 Tax=Streptomyces polyrhachis TaxID=1282885 RepID=A0ABW2GFH7_9ACTN
MRDTPRTYRIAAAAALAAAGVLAVGAAPPTAPPAPTTAQAGPGEWAGVPRAAGAPVEIDDTHRIAVPDEEALRFLGEAGAQVWVVAHAPWDTGTAPDAPADGGGVRRSLTAVEGPGVLTVYDVDADGVPAVRFTSADGQAQGYELPAGGQGDGTRWAFGAPGTYTLTVSEEAGQVQDATSGTQTSYTVLVGDEAIAAAAGATLPPQPSAAPGALPSAPGNTSATPASPAPASSRPTARPRTLIAPATRSTAVETDRTVLDEGHLDLAARVVDGRMQIHLKDGTVAGRTTWREPSSVVLHVKPAAKRKIPANADFAFLGKSGDPLWLLDQVQQDGLLWPGWSTENIPAGQTRGGVEFSLTKVAGPGRCALFTYDGLSGAAVLFNSGDGLPDSLTVAQNTHAHGGWAFTREGTYRLTFRMSATLADGTRVSDTETVAFAVGAADAGPAAPGDGSGTGPAGGDGGSDPAGSADRGSQGGSDAQDDTPPGGSMASTGAGAGPALGAAAAALTAAGLGFVLAARRRRRARD